MTDRVYIRRGDRLICHVSLTDAEGTALDATGLKSQVRAPGFVANGVVEIGATGVAKVTFASTLTRDWPTRVFAWNFRIGDISYPAAPAILRIQCLRAITELTNDNPTNAVPDIVGSAASSGVSDAGEQVFGSVAKPFLLVGADGSLMRVQFEISEQDGGGSQLSDDDTLSGGVGTPGAVDGSGGGVQDGDTLHGGAGSPGGADGGGGGLQDDDTLSGGTGTAPGTGAGGGLDDPDTLHGGTGAPGPTGGSGGGLQDGDTLHGGTGSEGPSDASGSGGGLQDDDTLSGGTGTPGAADGGGGGLDDPDTLHGGSGSPDGQGGGGNLQDDDTLHGGTGTPGPTSGAGGGLDDPDTLSGGTGSPAAGSGGGGNLQDGDTLHGGSGTGGPASGGGGGFDDPDTLGGGTGSPSPVTVDSLTFTDNNDGTPAQLDATFGGNPDSGWLITSTSATPPSRADMKAGTGAGTLEGTTFTPGSVVDLVGLTDASEPATHVHILIEDSSGNQAVETVAVSGLDFTAPVFSSAEIGNVDDTSLIVTIDSLLYGSTAAADWDVQVDGSPATESAVAFTEGTATIDITLGAAVAGGQVVTVAYTGSGLTDADGVAMETFTAQSVTNNLAAGSLGALIATQESLVNLTSGQNETLTFQAPAGVSLLIIAGVGSGNMNFSVTGPNLTSVRPVAWGFSTHVRVFRIDASAASDIVVAGSNGNSSSRRIYHLVDANGVAATGSEAHANDTSSPFTNSVSKAVGDLIVFVGFAANSDTTGSVLTGELTNADAISEILFVHGESDPRDDYIIVATGVADSAGTASYTITFDDGIQSNIQTVIMNFPV